MESSSSNLSIIWIEDIDRLCGKRSEYDQENTQIVSQLLTCIDGLRVAHRVLILATTTRPYQLDEALRRAGRFDKEIPILPPTQQQRKQILSLYFEEFHALEQVESLLDTLSILTRGFSGADLEMFVRQAMVASIEQSASLSLPFLLAVLGGIVPTIMKNEEKVAGISWNDIGGMDSIKTQLQKVIGSTFPSFAVHRVAHSLQNTIPAVSFGASPRDSPLWTSRMRQNHAGSRDRLGIARFLLDTEHFAGFHAVCRRIGGFPRG